MSGYAIAKYLRISSEDTDLKDTGKLESNSIAHQRNLLDSYIARIPDFSGAAVLEFCDDGWSGKNFERPAFQKMLAAIKQGQIQCVIVKDMSRFGRDYLVVGNYISRVFPFLGVRFIAVNDGIDSIRPNDVDSLDTSFRALIYDLYSRDLSRKVRSAEEFRAARGECLSPFAPFGYVKDPADRKHLLIDPPAAEIVHRIFQMTIDGLTSTQIAKVLNEEGIPTPMVYKRLAGCSRTIWPCVHEVNLWSRSAVKGILRNECYLGTTIYRRRRRDKVGNAHSVKNNRTDWIMVEDTHQGIVTQAEFDRAHMVRRKSSEQNTNTAKRSLLYGKIRCGICGYAMARSKAKSTYYYCETFRVTDFYGCSNERIYEQDILDTMLEGLRIRAAAAVESSRVWKEQHQQASKDVYAMKKKLVSLKESHDRQEHQIRGLYESFALGELSKAEYFAMKTAAVERRDEITDQIISLETALNDNSPDGKLNDEFVSHFQKYAEIAQLTPEIVSDVLKEIRVFPDNRIEITWNYQRDFENILSDLQEG